VESVPKQDNRIGGATSSTRTPGRRPSSRPARWTGKPAPACRRWCRIDRIWG